MSNNYITVSSYNMSAVSVLLILIFLFSSPLSAGERKTIVIIGDSLSAAHRIPLKTSWPQLLQNKLDANNYSYKIINTSVSGDTSYTALNRNNTMLAEHKPDICLIAIGANDGLQGLSLSQLKNNLVGLVKLCKKFTNKIILFEMKLPFNYGKKFIEQFANIYHDVARQVSITLLPFFMESFALDMNMFLDDRIHPTEAAQPIMSDIVWSELKKLIEPSVP